MVIGEDPRAQALCQDLLRELREDAGLTQYEMADELGVPQSAVSKIENGRRRIDVAELLVLCRVCDADPEAFVATLMERLGEDAGGHSSS